MTATIAPHPRSGKPIAVIKKWRPLDIDNPPDDCGVYAVKSADKWLYIGRSVHIRTRIKMRNHPIRVTQGLKSLNLSYWWHPVERSMLPRTELHLIAKHDPEWNGSTCFCGQFLPARAHCCTGILTEQEEAQLLKAICP